MKRIVVFGSITYDRTLHLPRLPHAGQGVMATAVTHSVGGKGANVSVAAARAGASSRGGSSVVGSASETDTSASREDDDLDDYFIKDGCVDVDDAVVEGPRSRGLVGLVTARALC